MKTTLHILQIVTAYFGGFFLASGHIYLGVGLILVCGAIIYYRYRTY